MQNKIASTLKKHHVSYEELKTHSSYSDAWIAINGIVYDITRFIDKHPFGDTFRGHLGTECGGLFSSAHCNTNVENLIRDKNFLKRNEIQVVGYLDISKDRLRKNNNKPFLDRIVYLKTEKDQFWQDLKSRVTSYLKESGETTHYTFREGLFYIVYHLFIYSVLAYFTWIEGSFLAAGLLGFHMICTLANISHMAAHSGFTRSSSLDFIASHLFDLSGMSGLEWQITHQTHHNQPHSSLDYQTDTYDWIGIRIHKYMKYKNYHKYQYIYFWLVVSAYLFFKIFFTTVWLFDNNEFVRHKREGIAHAIARGVVLIQVILCAYIHGLWMALALFSIYAIVYSQTAFILLFNDHEPTHEVLGKTEDVSKLHGKMSWAETQVRTSGDWYPTNWFLAFIEFHYGYFNYHIEHHLFPTFKPSLLKKISPIVREVCKKHNIPYISTPFFDVQKSLQKHISKLSLPQY